MVFDIPYAADAYGVRVLWDSSRHLPRDISMREFEERARRLEAVAPEPWRREIHARLTQGADHDGPAAHPFDASQLHAWELFVLERDGYDMHGARDAWTSADGIVNTVVPPTASDLTGLTGLAPIIRVWFADDPRDGLPYRFILVEGHDPSGE